MHTVLRPSMETEIQLFFMHYFENLSSNACSLLLLTCSVLRAKYENVSPCLWDIFHFIPHITVVTGCYEEAENHAQISVIVNEGDVNKDHLQRFDCFLFCFVFGLFFYFIEPF